MSQLIGKLISTMQAVIPAKLYCRFMQMTQIKDLHKNKHFKAMIPISGEVKIEQGWWINQLEVSNGKSIIGSNPSMILMPDASDIARWGHIGNTKHRRQVVPRRAVISHTRKRTFGSCFST